MEAVSGRLASLTLAEKSAFSLKEPEPEFIHQIDAQSVEHFGDDAKLAATSTNNMVRLFSRTRLAALGSVQGHTKAVSCVRFSRKDADIMYSASLDGTVRCWDLRASKSKAVKTLTGYDETNNVFLSFDMNSSELMLCAGTEAYDNDSFLIFWDLRSTRPLGVYQESHQDDITQVQFHPTNPDQMATCSTDGLVCVFDLREDCEDEAIVGTYNSGSSVSRIGWCGESKQNIYGITHIETFHIWEAVEGDTLLEIKDIRERFEGSDKVDYLVDCFHSEPGDILYLLTGAFSGQLRLFQIDGDDLQPSKNLDKGHTGVVRCMNWDVQSQSLVTGGEDAMLCLWKSASEGSEKQKLPTAKRKGKVPSSVKAKMKKKLSGLPS